MNEEDLVEVERLAQVHLEMSAEPRASTETMETSQRAADVIGPSLEAHARASAKAWVAGRKVAGSAALEAKLDRAMASILEAGRLVSTNEEAFQAADSEARDLSNNLRVLRSASREVREYLQLDLPVLQVSKSEVSEAGEDEVPIRFVQIGASSGGNITLPSAALRSSALVLMGSGIGSIGFEGLVGAIQGVIQAVIPAKLKIKTELVPLADVEAAWDRDSGKSRIVFIVS